MASIAQNRNFDRTYTVAEFVQMPEYHDGYELLAGKLVKKPMPKYKHSWITRFILNYYFVFDPQNLLGEFNPEISFNARPDYAPTPDLAYWVAGRVPDFEATISSVPDLAVEIQSPGQSMPGLTSKAQDYLDFGVRLVWLMQTEGRPQVRVWKPSATQAEILTLADTLTGEDVIPNFTLPVRQIFRQ